MLVHLWPLPVDQEDVECALLEDDLEEHVEELQKDHDAEAPVELGLQLLLLFSTGQEGVDSLLHLEEDEDAPCDCQQVAEQSLAHQV